MTFEHGASAYTNHKCRCDICKKGKSEKDRLYRAKNRDRLLAYRRERRDKYREYMRAWHAEHKEHDREYARRWRAENPQRVREWNQRSYDKHRDKRIAETKEWYEKNRDRARRRSKEYNEKNREKLLAKSRDWYENNRGKAAEYHRQRGKHPAAQAAARRRMAQFKERIARIPNDRDGTPWSTAEFAIIKQDDRYSIIEMATILHRSYGSVKAARTAIGHRTKRKW